MIIRSNHKSQSLKVPILRCPLILSTNGLMPNFAGTVQYVPSFPAVI